MKINHFHYVMSRGILGALIGILSGFVLAILIWGLQMLVVWMMGEPEFGKIPLAVVTLPSMCFGSIIGALSAINAASKEKSK